MKASIVIANYNNSNFIEECINSLTSQTYKNIEIIFFDDNSQDNSIDVIKKFTFVKVIQNNNQTKYGSLNQMNAFKKGINLSTGDIIFFLDSDDYFRKDKVLSVVREFKRKKNLKIIFDLPIWKFKDKLLKKKFSQKKFIISNWPRFSPQSCISVEKKFAKEFFHYVRIKKFETLWFDFRIASYTFLKIGNIYMLDKYLTYYRQLDNSASKKFKTLSKKWWYRRNQAHDFINYLEKKLNLKTKITLDKLLTRLINIL